MPSSPDRLLVNASWLIKLRWVAVVGQLLTVAAVVSLLKIAVPIPALAIIIGLTALSNGILHWNFVEQKRLGPVEGQAWVVWNRVLALVMTMDMLSLTALLYASGGPTNPFCLFFFVNLSLCAVVVTPGWARLLNVLSILCYAWLLYDHRPLTRFGGELEPFFDLMPISDRGAPSLIQWGLLVAFSTCSTVIVYFMTRLTSALRQQQLDLRKVEEQQAQSEKLEALGTLAAGAAHELATPLSTIAVVAGDVEKAIERLDSAQQEELADDIRLIRSELDRCRTILDRMSRDAGQTSGELMRDVSVREIWHLIVEDLPASNPIHIEFSANAEDTIRVPINGLCQAMRGLLQNAQQASLPEQPIDVTLKKLDSQWLWTIRDQGEGMSEDVLKRVSEPFFTTKQPGSGMGLGVFLAQNVLQRLGGSVKIESAAGVGTAVEIRLPFHDSN